MYTCIYSGTSIKDTIGTSQSVLIKEVSLFRRLLSTVTYYIGTLRSVPIMEVSLFWSVLIREVPLYTCSYMYYIIIVNAPLSQRSRGSVHSPANISSNILCTSQPPSTPTRDQKYPRPRPTDEVHVRHLLAWITHFLSRASSSDFKTLLGRSLYLTRRINEGRLRPPKPRS